MILKLLFLYTAVVLVIVTSVLLLTPSFNTPKPLHQVISFANKNNNFKPITSTEFVPKNQTLWTAPVTTDNNWLHVKTSASTSETPAVPPQGGGQSAKSESAKNSKTSHFQPKKRAAQEQQGPQSTPSTTTRTRIPPGDMYKPRPSTVNPHPFKFLHLEEDICTKRRKDVFILSVVHTAPNHYKHRMVIRETWGSQKLYDKVKTVVIFAIGATNDRKVQNSINLESQKYHDIIQEDFLDSYKNLTYKSIMWLKWVAMYCPRAAFVLKVDDDIFVNIFNLVGHLEYLYNKKMIKERTILCLVWPGMAVVPRNPKSKWFVTRDEYPNDRFSTYCSGSAYVLTNQLVKPMYEQSFKIKFFWIDDFYVTGLLPKHLDVEYRNIGSLYVLRHQQLHDRLVDGYAIFGHIPDSLSERYKLWNEILKMRGIKNF